MSRVALDFTKINTPNYRTYRVISAPNKWAQFYRDRVSAMAQHSSGLIFPEQLLSLDQKAIWGVTVSVGNKGVSAGITSIGSFHPTAWDADLSTPEGILAFEHEHEPGDLKLGPRGLKVQRYANSDTSFGQYWLFTNRREALKCVTNRISRAVNAL